MRISCVGSNGGFVLDDPEGEIHGDPFVAEEIEILGSSIGFEQIPEVPSHSHSLK